VGRDAGLHCPDTYGQWSVGLYDCRKAVGGYDEYEQWQTTSLSCSAFMAATTGVWHHCALTFDGTTRHMYIDGTDYLTVGGPCGSMSANIGDFLMGQNYTGDLDDVVIYNRYLSASDVAALMALPPSCCDGVASASRSSKPAVTIKGKEVRIFPNPSGGEVFVSAGEATIQSISVINSTGQCVGTYTFSSDEVSLNLGNLAPGMYLLKIVTDKETSIQKLIRN
jgi:hypothetical protein